MTSTARETEMLQIRATAETDLAAVAEIYWSAWHETHAPFIPAAVAEFRDRQFFAKRACGFGARLIVADLDGVVMGFTVWDEASLQQLWLRRDARGLGIGDKLANAAEGQIAAAGTTRAHLTCMAANEPARRFYERRDWHVVDRFDKPLETAQGHAAVPCLRMEKELAPAGR